MIIAAGLVGFFIVVCLVLGLAAILNVARERPYECEVCGGFFSARDSIELTETWLEADGGSAMTATFCLEHKP